MPDIPRELGSLISTDATGFIRLVSHEAAREAARQVIAEHVQACPHAAMIEKQVAQVDTDSRARDERIKSDIQIRLWKLVALMAGSGVISGAAVKALSMGI